MGHSLWRPFLCVGLAYFLVAVLFPLAILRNEAEGKWTVAGVWWSFIAGVIGAIGALGIVLAFKAGAKPIYVMPLVFGCAPVVNTLVTMFMNQTYRKVNIPFFLAIALVALGAAGVMRYKPKPQKTTAAVNHNHAEDDDAQAAADDGDSGNAATDESNSSESEADQGGQTGESESISSAEAPSDDSAIFQWFTSVFSVVVTALCWGSYGPILHMGQARMHGSRLRPFICVGLAYFVIGVIVPSFVLMQFGEVGNWSPSGTMWSLAAGAAGAVGALGIIMAFNSGGKPVFVMPLVFGFAPVINTIDSVGLAYLKTKSIGQITTPFLVSLGLVITGAVCVLLFAPKGKKPSKDLESTPEDHTSTSSPESSASLNGEASSVSADTTSGSTS